MSEDLNITTETPEKEHEHKSHHHRHRSHSSSGHHHRSHHHSGSHHSDRHRHSSSSHHSSHSSSSHNGNQSISKRITSFFKKLSGKLTFNTASFKDKFKKIARSQKTSSERKYTIISKRISFCIILTAIICYSIFVLLSSEDSSHIRSAGRTPSEISILKIQIMDLEQKNARLQQELNRYKELYGELDKAE